MSFIICVQRLYYNVGLHLNILFKEHHYLWERVSLCACVYVCVWCKCLRMLLQYNTGII